MYRKMKPILEIHRVSTMGSRRSAGAALETNFSRGGGRDECDGVFSRRTKSTGRLLGLTNQSPLDEAIEQIVIFTKMFTREADGHRKTGTSFQSYGRDERNAAIADVSHHHGDLFKLQSSNMTRAANELRYSLEEIKAMKEAEKRVREVEQRLAGLYDKKSKYVKILRKGSNGILRRRSEDNTLKIRQELEEITMDIERNEIELDEAIKEMEVIKMFKYRNGMRGMADAMIKFGNTTAAIFGCFREITEMVPAVSTQDVNTMNYDGALITKNCMNRLRRVFEISASSCGQQSQLMGPLSRRRSEPHRNHQSIIQTNTVICNGTSTPPPPYTPTAPILCDLPQPGSITSSTIDTSLSYDHIQSPPRFNSLYPKLSPNPYHRRSGLHS